MVNGPNLKYYGHGNMVTASEIMDDPNIALGRMLTASDLKHATFSESNHLPFTIYHLPTFKAEAKNWT